jgi:hypothetical protein
LLKKEKKGFVSFLCFLTLFFHWCDLEAKLRDNPHIHDVVRDRARKGILCTWHQGNRERDENKASERASKRTSKRAGAFQQWEMLLIFFPSFLLVFLLQLDERDCRFSS